MIFKFPIVGGPINDSPLGLVSLSFLYKMKIAFIALFCPKGSALISSSSPWLLLRCSQNCIHETIFFLVARLLRWSLTECLSLFEKLVLKVAFGNLKMGSSLYCALMNCEQLWKRSHRSLVPL